LRSRFKALKPVRHLTLHEEVILAKQPSDVWLPDRPSEREDAIDRLARTELKP